MEPFHPPQGCFKLHRYPRRTKEMLRAWDAADEYLLAYLSEQAISSGDRPLLLNDGFGALAVAFAEQFPVSVSDSFISHAGTKQNMVLNGFDEDSVECLSALDDWPASPGLVLMKIPKSHALLEYQLHRLRPHVNRETRIIAAGMAKHIHSSTLQLFERIIGPTQTSLAKKKARLVFASWDESLTPPANPYPIVYPLEGSDLEISNHANVFSREKLDIGTRFFLEHLPEELGDKTLIDLGCGNGLLGVEAARRNPQIKPVFVDESYMAVASARDNFERAIGGDRSAEFRVTNILDGVSRASADVILNNPPFHQQHAVGDAVAWSMFRQSQSVLKPGGEFYVIGNRHLGYHTKLKRLFGNCQTVASNRKFVILKTTNKG